MSRPSDLVQGTLDLLLLKILALEPLHGWAIGQRLKQVSGDVLQVSDGSLYPSLHKLEQEGWMTAEKGPLNAGISHCRRCVMLTFGNTRPRRVAELTSVSLFTPENEPSSARRPLGSSQSAA